MQHLIKNSLIPFLFLLCFLPLVSSAASVSVSSPDTVHAGESFEVFINVDSSGVLINSASIVLDYDEDLISFSGYKDDGAIMQIWVVSPHAENGNIYFSGIIPGGVTGLYDPKKEGLSPVPLARLIFTAKQEGNLKFSFLQTEILEHDGLGTELTHEQIGSDVLVAEAILSPDGSVMSGEFVDTEKPEPFEITFLDSSLFARTSLMIAFQASDTGSGIKEYKINTGGENWRAVKSPEPVRRGFFSSALVIRAYDFYGNFQDASVQVPGILSPELIISILVFLALCIAGYKVLK